MCLLRYSSSSFFDLSRDSHRVCLRLLDELIRASNHPLGKRVLSCPHRSDHDMPDSNRTAVHATVLACVLCLAPITVALAAGQGLTGRTPPTRTVDRIAVGNGDAGQLADSARRRVRRPPRISPAATRDAGPQDRGRADADHPGDCWRGGHAGRGIERGPRVRYRGRREPGALSREDRRSQGCRHHAVHPGHRTRQRRWPVLPGDFRHASSLRWSSACSSRSSRRATSCSTSR